MNDDPTELILVSTAVVVATSIVRNLYQHKTGSNKWTPLIYGFVLAMALLLIATVSAGFARGLAYMALVGAFVTNGPAIFELVQKLGK